VVRFKDSIAIQVSEKKKPQVYCKRVFTLTY
jgi:hypothetical protein